jgi:hypothetical protein
MMMVDAVIPGAFGAWLPAVESTLAAVIGQDTDRALADKVAESLRAVKSKVMGPYSGAIHNTLLFLVVAHDDARGGRPRPRVSQRVGQGSASGPLRDGRRRHSAVPWRQSASRDYGGRGALLRFVDERVTP